MNTYKIHITIAFVLSILAHGVVLSFTRGVDFGGAGSGKLSVSFASYEEKTNGPTVLRKSASRPSNKKSLLPIESKIPIKQPEELNREIPSKPISPSKPVNPEPQNVESQPVIKAASFKQAVVEEKVKSVELVKQKTTTEPVQVTTQSVAHKKPEVKKEANEQKPIKKVTQDEIEEKKIDQQENKDHEIEGNKQENMASAANEKNHAKSMHGDNSALANATTATKKSYGKSKKSSTLKSNVRTHPVYESNPTPDYPARARELGQQGTVILLLLISADGSVNEAKVSESSGYSLLDESALNTVERKWQFTPGTLNGKPADCWVRVPIKFNISGG